MSPNTQDGPTDPAQEKEDRIAKLTKLAKAPLTLSGPFEPEEPEDDDFVGDPIEGVYGEPWARDAKGKPCGLNEKYWAVRWAQETGIVFSQIEKSFFVCSKDFLWEPKDRGQAANLIDEFIRRTKDVDLEDVQLERLLNYKSTENVAKISQSLEGVVQNFFFEEAPMGVIYTKNGRLEISENGQISFSPERGRREDRQRHRLNINYDPKAKARRLYRWLHRIFKGRSDDIAAVQNFLGGCLYGKNEWKKMLVVHGEANLGKGKIGDVAAELCGLHRRVAFNTNRFNDRFNAFSLVGKTILQAGDARADFLASKCADLLKELVGGDPIPAEQKFTHHDPDLRGVKHIIIATNFELQVRAGIDRSAWEERLIYLHADGPPYAVGERDRNLVGNLFKEPDEASGILLFALLGLRRILRHDWQHSPAQKARIVGVMEKSDSVAKFVAEMTHKASSKSATTEELYGAYHRWARKRNWTPWPKTDFEKMIEESVVAVWGISKSHDIERFDKIQRGFRGIEILMEGESAAMGVEYDIKAA